MKKLFLLALLVTGMFVFVACDPAGIPDDATVATCTQGNEFMYVYKDDVVYEFYSDGTLQNDDMLNIVQNAVNSAGDVETYLSSTFASDVCTFVPYTSTKK